MTSKAKKAVCFSVVAVIVVLFIVLDILANVFFTPINAFVCGNGVDFNGEETQQAMAQSDALVRTLAEDSMVLLKNSETDGEPALPLKENETKVNLFGISAYDPSDAASFDGFLMKGVGSGSSTISQSRAVTLEGALELNGISYNPDLKTLYDGFDFGRAASGNNDPNVYLLAEPSIDSVKAAIPAAKEYSDVAIVVFSRLGGENQGEQPKTQPDNPNKTYLDISDSEQALLDEVTENFGKVIVLLNTSNIMHCGFLEDEGVDAAMYVGLTGQSGAVAIGEILKGKKLDGTQFSPSGKVSDTYIYTREYDPGFANTEMTQTDEAGINIQYMENIYFGYRWYETAAAEGYFDNVNNEYGSGYDGVVQYPFGYGLSYTSFEWDVIDVSLPDGSEITDSNKNNEISVKVLVTNTGDFAGKDVVELYYTPEYVRGEIEKSEVNLLDFEKTVLLAPGASQELTLSFTPYDMASFDTYDANRNGASVYELDAGTYTVSLRTDSHNVAKCDGATISYTLPGDVTFNTDPTTGASIAPLFSGDSAYGGVDIEGRAVGASTNYLSRADIAGTFPREKSPVPTNGALISQTSGYSYDGFDTSTMPTQGVNNGSNTLSLTLQGENGLEYNYDLFAKLSDYSAPEWETLLNQITVSELINLVHLGGFMTKPVDSIGKPLMWDFDGPAGFNTNSQSGSWGGGDAAAETWTAYPCECLLGCSWNKELLLQMGLSMGVEANATQVNGWYAPGINLHRTNYTSRNYEYYSEDPVLSGYLAANVITGAKYNGLYVYMKHFVVSESGPNGREWNTWLTEQALRELYLKPFEISVKKGGANAVMSSFNRIGCIWAGGNKALLTDILRTEWGFTGSVITDWTMGGITGMPPKQGVRAGNDLWLAGMNMVFGGTLDENDATDVSRARNAAHNILYTMVDTLNFSHTADRSELDAAFTVNVGVANRTTPFAWWLMLLIIVEVLAFAGCAVWIFFTVKKQK